jgi:gamma-glutamyltranspeptidase/glutathione hydrolase/leukotriene-C4 hydrolase
VKAIAVPGELRALETAWNLYRSGKVTWFQLFEPTINLTRDGFVVEELMAARIKV